MTDKDKKNKLAPHLVPRRALASFSNYDTFGRVALLTSLFASVDVPLDQSSESRPAGPNLVQLLSRRFLMGSDCWPPAAAGVVVEPSTRQPVRVRCAPPAAAICIEQPLCTRVRVREPPLVPMGGASARLCLAVHVQLGPRWCLEIRVFILVCVTFG